MARKAVKRTATIKLNLMPPYIAAARMTRVAAVVTVIVCLLILGGMGLWWQTNAAGIARLNETLQQKDKEAQVVLDLESKAQQKRQEVADISNALKVLDDIRKSGDEWANILQKIAEWIPEEVKLTELTLQGSPTSAQSVRLVGYTTSVMKLRDFYSQLSQSALFSSVSLVTVDKNGIPVPVAGLPPILPKEKPKPEVGAELAPQGQQGQPAPTPGAPTPSGGPGMGCMEHPLADLGWGCMERLQVDLAWVCTGRLWVDLVWGCTVDRWVDLEWECMEVLGWEDLALHQHGQWEVPWEQDR